MDQDASEIKFLSPNRRKESDRKYKLSSQKVEDFSLMIVLIGLFEWSD